MAEKCVLDKVEDILTCSTCLEVLVDPKTFNCLHSYCRGCVERLHSVKQGSVEGYECPQCRRFTPKKEVRVVHLIVQLLDAYHAAQNAPKNPKCEQCGVADALWKCIECNEENMLCGPCKLQHDKFSRKFGTQHQVISLDELQDAHAVLNKPMYCSEHKENKLEVFCTQCQKTICVLCKIFHHADHEAEPITDALKRLLPQIDASTQQIESNIKENKEAIKVMAEEKEEVIKSYKEKEKQLAKQLEDDIAKLRAEHKVRNDELKLKQAQEVKDYDQQIREAENKITEQNQVIAWVKTTKARTSGVTLLKELQDGLLDQVEKIASELPIDATGTRMKQSRCWPLKLVTNRSSTVKGKTITLIASGAYPYTRVAILWNVLWLLHQRPRKLYKYDLNGVQVAEIQLDQSVTKPRAAIQINSKEALLVSKSGLHVIHESGQIQTKILTGDYSDVCSADDGRIYALERNNGIVACLQQQAGGLTKLQDITLHDYHQDNQNYRDYTNTLVVHGGTMCVSMVYVHKIVKYDMSGKKLQLFDGSVTGFSAPSICGITSNKTLVICDHNNQKLKTMSEQGEIEEVISTAGYPWHATFHMDNSVWVLFANNILQEYLLT